MENNELQHHGIKGQKWGLRRFQNPDGSLTAAGKKRYADDDDTKKTETPKTKTKEDVLKSGSAKDILEFKGDLTNKEYEDAFRRLDYEKKMTSYSKAETMTALEKFSGVMDKVDKVRVGTQKAIDVYNVVAKVNNTFNPSFRLPEINSGGINKAFQKAEEAREVAEATAKAAAEAAKKRKRLEKLEKDVDEKGADVLKRLDTQELKDLADRTNQKKNITTNKKVYDNKSAKKEAPKKDDSADKSMTRELVSRAATAALSMYESGKSVADIARQYGVTESAIYKLLDELK